MRSLTLVGLLASQAAAQLNTLAKSAGLHYFGTALDTEISDSAYAAIAATTSEFGQATPGNGQKWDSTEPSKNTFSYTKAEVIPDFANKNGQILRCHNLVWYNQLPSWVSSGSWTKAELTSIIQAHISNVVGHFKGDCYAWDVVNEPADDSGNWRSDVFYNTLGEDYLAIAFKAARAADPAAKLYLNEYNLEYNGAKTDLVVSMVKLIQAAGSYIDGVGFEGHMIVGSVPSRASLATAMNRFTALGIEVAFTEVDVRHPSLPPTTAQVEQQAKDYAAMVGACLDVDKCVGVTVWGFGDKYSWIPSTFSGAGEACLYNSVLSKKPAWTSVSSVLAAGATAGAAAAANATTLKVVATPTPVAAASSTVVKAVASGAGAGAGAAAASTATAIALESSVPEETTLASTAPEPAVTTAAAAKSTAGGKTSCKRRKRGLVVNKSL